MAVGIKLLTLLGRDVHDWASDFITRHGIDVANRYAESFLAKLEGVGDTQLVQMSTVAFGYSALLSVEGFGLWFQKRWAEYLTAIATGLLIPVEVYEIYERFTFIRLGILALNLFIVWYLVTRLRDEKHVNAGWIPPLPPGPPKVKICGITNVEDARHAVESGADQLGLNFYKKSKRYITPKKARELVDSLPIGIEMIGVFVNEPIDDVVKTATYVGLDGIQLHGDENNCYVRDLKQRTKLPVIKAFSVSRGFAVSDALHWDSEYKLFDTYSATERGGTGKTFDWDDFAADIYLWFPGSAYLAGGLTPDNVAEAVRVVKPYAVDVASGVEASPGRKDPKRIAAFIKAAKEAL